MPITMPKGTQNPQVKGTRRTPESLFISGFIPQIMVGIEQQQAKITAIQPRMIVF
jgi:hypothetical protein